MRKEVSEIGRDRTGGGNGDDGLGLLFFPPDGILGWGWGLHQLVTELMWNGMEKTLHTLLPLMRRAAMQCNKMYIINLSYLYPLRIQMGKKVSQPIYSYLVI